MAREIIHVSFRTEVSVGGHPQPYWSKRRGETDHILKATTCNEGPVLGQPGVHLTWAGGSTPESKEPIEVPRENITQIQYAPAVVAAAPAKK